MRNRKARRVTARYRWDRLKVSFWFAPALMALAAVLTAWYLVRQGRYGLAFVSSSGMILFLILAAAVGLYPNLLLSTIDPAYNLTINNAASASNTLTVMFVIALIGMRFVLLYTAGVYYIFRGRVRLGPGSY